MLTLEKLKQMLYYDPETGLFFWKINAAARIKIGDKAGTLDKTTGYIRITIEGKHYRASRLAWFYIKGKWPEKHVDHINTIKVDNSWANLREATNTQNMQNTNKYINNTSGFKGVYRRKDRNTYRALISVNGKKIYLPCRNTPEEAFELYKEAAIKYFGEFANY